MKAGANKAKTKTLAVKSDDPTARDATPEERIARHVATAATVQATSGTELWLTQCVGEPDFTALAHKIRDQTNAMHTGDMKGIESMLFAQALTLQATFTALSRKAAANASEYLAATDTYLRLALKAQGQCRATLETLANINNPRPVAFVKQANVSNGPQQVNNGVREANNSLVRAREENEIPQNELLTDTRAAHGKTVDTRAKSKAGASHSRVAIVGNGPQGRVAMKVRLRLPATLTRALRELEAGCLSSPPRHGSFPACGHTGRNDRGKALVEALDQSQRPANLYEAGGALNR